MTCSPEHIASQIRQKGFRLTPQRVAILNILHDSGGHLIPVEVFKKAGIILPGITEPTVYRTLDFLVDNNFASVTHAGGGRLEYELAMHQHQHHHLVCAVCGIAEEISQERLQSVYDQFEQVTGFRLIENHYTFIGLCPRCK